MNIVLTGFMGTGKSTVGRRLAERLHAPFVDVDSLIEKEAGHSIRMIFEKHGESWFRDLEHQVIRTLASRDHTVIATGGGALLREDNRLTLRKNGFLVCLTAKTGTLLERLREDLARPLLAGASPEARIDQLMKEREAVYAQCDLQLPTDDRTIDEVARAIQEATATRWKSA